MAQRPRYSILLPTRNGLRYLPFAIDSVLSQPFQDFELVVSDNHSTDGTAAYLETIKDPRFRHIRPPQLLSMLAHFEYLTAQATGDWVTILGDDDGVLPFFFERLQKLDPDSLGTDAIVFRRAYYFWPGCGELHGDKAVIYYPTRARHYLNNKWSLLLCLSSISNYMQLPQLYTTGLIRRTFIDEVKRQTGDRFYFGTSPDASSVVAMALHARRHCRVEEPIFWVGTSPKSTGYSTGSSINKDRIAEFWQLGRRDKNEEAEIIPEKVRQLPALSAVLYDALLANPATGRFWSSRLIRNFFLAGMMLKHPEYNETMREAYGESFSEKRLSWHIQLLKKIDARERKREAEIDAKNESLPSLQSQDHQTYPTLRTASDAAGAIWPGNPA
jgi:glycosyltransferase involved in cell wall biosynthesis